MARDIAAEIDTACERRQAAWAAGDAERAKTLSTRIEALYEEKRTRAASHGSPAKRDVAIRRAKVEQELDRLMQS